MIRLVIDPADMAAINAAAAAAWPHEACGLLVGTRADDSIRVQSVIVTENIARDPERRFEVEPRALLSAHREARTAGQELLGPWHSHPDGPARPSATDSVRAVSAGEVWLIVPVAGGQAGAAWAWLFDGGAFAEIVLET